MTVLNMNMLRNMPSGCRSENFTHWYFRSTAPEEHFVYPVSQPIKKKTAITARLGRSPFMIIKPFFGWHPWRCVIRNGINSLLMDIHRVMCHIRDKIL